MMSKILLSLIAIQISLYSLEFTTSGGTQKSMSEFQGRKLLLVNIASGSPLSSQLNELQQLQQTYADSLTVIAFPTNSFGHEPLSNQQLFQLAQANGLTYLLSEKVDVSGAMMQPIYQWLSDSTQNGDASIAITQDFQKVLISADGHIAGVFASVVSPLDSLIHHAIRGQ